MIRSSVGGNLISCNFLHRPLCHTASNAFSTSISRSAASLFLFLGTCNFLGSEDAHLPLCSVICSLPGFDDFVIY